MSANCEVIIIFPIFVQFGATGTPDPGCMFFKSYIVINSYLLSYKNCKQN